MFPRTMKQVDISIINNIGTLLEIIPSELFSIINHSPIQFEHYQRQEIIEAHGRCNLKSHIICHVCKINPVPTIDSIALRIIKKPNGTIPYSLKHPCCLDCNEKHERCDECDKILAEPNKSFQNSEGIIFTPLAQCCFCYSEISLDKCFTCERGINDNIKLIKMYHRSFCEHAINGKIIISFCDDNKCRISPFQSLFIDNELTIFDNDDDKINIKNRIQIPSWIARTARV